MATTSGVVPRKAGGVDFEAATDMTSDGVALVPSVPSPQVRISAPSRIDLHTARRGTHRPSRQATGDARRWLAEHGEQGFRYPGDRTEEILEEQLAKAFRQHVVDLMLEYAHFDEERRFYCDRAVAIALLCFAFALLCFALRCFPLLCLCSAFLCVAFALISFALLCLPLLCFAFLCVAFP